MFSTEFVHMLLNEMSNSSNMGNLNLTSLNFVHKISPHSTIRMRRRWLPL
jgi:hypothetical protein